MEIRWRRESKRRCQKNCSNRRQPAPLETDSRKHNWDAQRQRQLHYTSRTPKKASETRESKVQERVPGKECQFKNGNGETPKPWRSFEPAEEYAPDLPLGPEFSFPIPSEDSNLLLQNR